MKFKAEIGHWSSIVGNSVHLIGEDGRFLGQIAIMCQDDRLRDKDVQTELCEKICAALNADLCASGQQVRALPRAVGDDRKAGWTLSFEDLQDIRDAAGDWGYSIDLEAVEAIALEVERRILAALTPAPQAATPTAQEAEPVDVRKCQTCQGFGWIKNALNKCPDCAIPPACQQEAVPVAWRCKDYADGWILYGNKAQAELYQACTGCLMEALYAHPPRPSETVAEARSSEAVMQALLDPENQPSQFGTVPLEQYEALEAAFDQAVGLLEGIAKDVDSCAWLEDDDLPALRALKEVNK